MFIPGNNDDAYTLSNGFRIPPLAMGTYKMPESDETADLVRQALEAGYRHIDTATLYQNETAVGRGIEAAGLPREDLFITTKLDNPYHSAREARLELRRSLDRLNLDYLDLWLIHWPVWAERKTVCVSFFSSVKLQRRIESSISTASTVCMG